VTSHSILGASRAHQWWHCGYWVKNASGANLGSVWAAEGTAAHELAQRCLVDNHDASHLLGTTIGEFEVTEEMAAAVQMYVAVCRRLIDACDVHMIEQHITLGKLNPPVDMFGTADFIAYSRKRREVHVVDFKFGKGVWIATKNNPQLMYYALGAVLAIDEPVSSISMTIVQPRVAKSDPFRNITIDAVEMAEWSLELLDRAHAAMKPNAPAVAGDWCKFCPIKNSCLAHQNSRNTAAYHEFSLPDAHVAGA
jgi:hypothetical protein